MVFTRLCWESISYILKYRSSMKRLISFGSSHAHCAFLGDEFCDFLCCRDSVWNHLLQCNTSHKIYLYWNSYMGHWWKKPTTLMTSPSLYLYRPLMVVITTSYNFPITSCNKNNKTREHTSHT